MLQQCNFREILRVRKRNGELELFSLDEIVRKVSSFSDDLNVDPLLVSRKSASGLYDGISTSEIDAYVSETAVALSAEHPDYSLLAARIKVSDLHRKTQGFIHCTGFFYNAGLLDEGYHNLVMSNRDVIEGIIDYERDYGFDYFALVTMIKLYLLNSGNRTLERPQDMWMRVALTCGSDGFNESAIRETYDMLSQGYYIHATPTLFNSGLKIQQLSSCFLTMMEDDSIEGIFNTLKETALISKTAGGIGINVHNIRGRGSIIKSTNGRSNGLIPFLKIFNETARSVDQGGGKRKGAFSVYLEPWHMDIIEFLELRRNTGAEEFRARDLFYALWVPDLFMQRVEEDADWTLMSEHLCPGLSDVYGEEFEKIYTEYEARNLGVKTMKARDLMSKIIEAQIETGQPYMLYKDAVNRKSNQKNVGVIKSSNLCAEIVEYSGKDETAVCNLASIALPRFVTENGEFDYERLRQMARLATKNLDRIIDITWYPVAKAKRSNERNRPVGLGTQGLADVFFAMKLPYTSEKAREINRLIFETIYFGAMQASMEMAREKEPYPNYEGSPVSRGLFQFDLWGVQPSRKWDWESLRQDILKYGVRNSLTTACMPTASTGIILGNTETFQIQTSNIYKRKTLSGEFLLVNRYLVKELEKRNLWNKEMRDAIILANGSVQNISSFPEELKPIFRTIWETSQKNVIDMSAERAPFIDQSQSMNLWLANPTFGMVNSMHMYAWKKGLKTGMYYLRSRPAVEAVKVTVSPGKAGISAPEAADRATKDVALCSDDESCLICSA